MKKIIYTFLKLKLLCVMILFIIPFTIESFEGDRNSDSQKIHQKSNRTGNATEKLKDQLEGVFIKKIPAEKLYRPGRYDSVYVASIVEPVKEAFEKECLTEFYSFKTGINLLIGVEEYNSDGNAISAIPNSVKNCTNIISNKYNILENNFVKPLNIYYTSSSIDIGGYYKGGYCENTVVDLSAHNTIIIKRQTPKSKNLKEIQKFIKEYKSFEYNCISKFKSLQIAVGQEKLCSRSIHDIEKERVKYSIFSAYLQKKDKDKSCHERREYFMDKINELPFKEFIALPKKCKTNINNFKNLLNGECKSMIDKISPEYPHKNSNNLFYRCHEAVKKADKDCFGEEGKRNELQEILHLVNQKSTALCEDNKLARAEIARKKCFDRAIKTCWDSCQSEIEEFKSNYLECFFLPDFKRNSYNILHGKNKCNSTIKALQKSFKKQAKEAFNIEENKLDFENLDLQNNHKASPAFKILNNCNNPLEENKIKEKIEEMRTVCQKYKQENSDKAQNNNPNNLANLLNTTLPTNKANSSNNNNKGGSSSSSAGGSVGSGVFQYGNGNNKGLNINNNGSQFSEGQNQNSNFKVDSPFENSQNKKITKDTDTDFTPDFSDFTDDLELSKAELSSGVSGSSSSRGLSSDGSSDDISSESESSSLEGENTEETSKVSSTIRRALSSDREYGAFSGNGYSQSATQGFFGWLGEQKDKAKKATLNTYDRMVGIDRPEFQKRMHLNNEQVNLYRLQGDMFIQACQSHNCRR